MYCCLDFFAAVAALVFCDGSVVTVPDSPSTSRDLIQSYIYGLEILWRHGYVTTYQLVDIPASVLASTLSLIHTLTDMEMPVHVSSFLLLAIFVGLEASATLRAWCTKMFIQTGK